MQDFQINLFNIGDMQKKPQIGSLPGICQGRDMLVVTRLDRLARSTLHLCQIASDLERKQVHLQVLDQSINTGDATGRLPFNMLGAIAQFETEIRAERQRDGILRAHLNIIQLSLVVTPEKY